MTHEQLLEELEFAKKEIAVLRAHNDEKDLKIIKFRWDAAEAANEVFGNYKHMIGTIKDLAAALENRGHKLEEVSMLLADRVAYQVSVFNDLEENYNAILAEQNK